ncbi:MAG: glycosyltransferase [Planctomycetaceae bacterium]
MKFLIVNTDYPAFLDELYASRPGLSECAYDEQLRVRNETLFGVSDFYPRRLKELGHDATEVHINNRALQRTWAAERGIPLPDEKPFAIQLRRGWIPWLTRDENRWVLEILAAQIEHYRPDVLLTHAIADIDAEFWKRMRGTYRLLVGQIASPLNTDVDLRPFDLMLSSLPNFVERFRRAGVRAELFRLAFDPSVLERLEADEARTSAADRDRNIDVSFVGTLSAHHADRIEWLEEICSQLNVKVWGNGVDELPASSAIRLAYQGPAWGVEMYRIHRRSRISLNHHIGLSGEFANNMRLYESTGTGTLLLTDLKTNLGDLFEIGREVAAYESVDDCIRQIRYYLDNPDAGASIAGAGQQRTLRDHTYRQRMEQLVAIVGNLR